MRSLLPALVAAASCSHSAPPAPREQRPEVVLSPAGGQAVRVKVELARDPQEQAKGLMYRDHLEPGWGMLFLNSTPRHLTFWMHNTYIPLDMIFIGADKRVVGAVESAEPLTDDARSVPGESQYVLEVPGGFCARHRVGPGTVVSFVDVE
jgi:uncharacterized membrane protein (UPF0127 family)